MDPVSIGIAAAALVGSKAMEEFATQAGSTAWLAVRRMGTSVRSRLSPRGDLSDEERVRLAGEIEDAAAIDPGFRAEIEGLLKHQAELDGLVKQRAELDGLVKHQAELDGPLKHQAELDGPLKHQAELDGPLKQQAELDGLVKQRAAVVGVARDHARQVNIGGGNSGPITL